MNACTCFAVSPLCLPSELQETAKPTPWRWSTGSGWMASGPFCCHMVQFLDKSLGDGNAIEICASHYNISKFQTCLNLHCGALLCIHFLYSHHASVLSTEKKKQSKCWISFSNFTGYDIALCNPWAPNSATAPEQAKSLSMGFIISSWHVWTSLCSSSYPRCSANLQAEVRKKRIRIL